MDRITQLAVALVLAAAIFLVVRAYVRGYLDGYVRGLRDALMHFLGRSSDQDTNDRQKYLRR